MSSPVRLMSCSTEPNCPRSFCAVFCPTPASGDVVGGIAHEREQIDDLCGLGELVFFADGGFVQCFHGCSSPSGAAHGYVRGHELRVVLVGGKHVHVEPAGGSLLCHSAYHVIGFVAGRFENGDSVSAYDVFDERHCVAYVLGGGLALRLVFRISLVAEGGSGGVERHSQIVRLVVAQEVFERIDETEYG